MVPPEVCYVVQDAPFKGEDTPHSYGMEQLGRRSPRGFSSIHADGQEPELNSDYSQPTLHFSHATIQALNRVQSYVASQCTHMRTKPIQ